MPHTPAPWKRDRHDGAGAIIIDGDKDHPGIASVNRYERHDVEANARLICAATDLLACLCELLEDSRSQSVTGSYIEVRNRPLVQRCVNAIAKARGEIA